MASRADGTWAYWAPEIVMRKPQDAAVDMWAFGLLVYIVLMGYHPFDPKGTRSDAEILAEIAKGRYDGKSSDVFGNYSLRHTMSNECSV